MAASAGTVTLNLDANSVKLLRELQKTERRTRQSANTMAADFGRSFTRIAKTAAVGAVAVAGAMAVIFRSQSKAIDELGKTADAVGVSTERLQALQHMAVLTGTSADALTNNLQRMQRRLGEIARNGGPSEKTLNDIGLSIKDIINLSADKQLEEIAKAMDSVQNAALRASIANDLFGRDGVRMLNMLDQLKKDGLDPVVAQLDAMGISISRIDSARLERANDAMVTARAVVTGVFQRLTVNMSDFVFHFAEAFTDIAKNTDMLGEQVDKMFRRIIMGSVDVFEAVGNALSPIISIVRSLWEGFMELPQFAREIGIVGALLFGRMGLVGVAAMLTVVKGIQSAVGSAASQLSGGAGFEDSQLDRLAKFMSGETEFSPIEKVAGLFSPDYENNVNRQASWLRGQMNTLFAERDEFVRRMSEDPMFDDPGIRDLLDGPDFAGDLEETANKMSQFAKQAANNMQSAFADFLFDPFKDGLKGMLSGFIDIIRRMIAQVMASQILLAMFGHLAGSANPILAGIGQGFGGTAPTMDLGGRGKAGQAVMIGRGAQPEMFIPDSAGTFIPNADKMGGQALTINVDARDEGAEARIRDMINREMAPQIIAAATGSTVAALRRPRFA